MDNTHFIGSGTRIQRNEQKFLASKLGEEMVMMNMETGDFVTMNSVGADIWALTEQSMTFDELVAQLLLTYDITTEQCREETLQFLELSQAEHMFVFS